MASLRSVRKRFRKESLRLVSSGDGNVEILKQLAGSYFGHQIGYEVLINSFLQNEVSNAMSYMRSEGEVESVGKKWKPVADLNEEDIDVLSSRRLRRLRGELTAEIRLCHEHGRTEAAISASEMLAIVSARIVTADREKSLQSADTQGA